MTALRGQIPNLVTALGLACGLAGLALGPWKGLPLLSASVLCDLFDGYLARRLKAESKIGAFFDWQTDCALAHAALWVALAPLWAAIGSGALVVVQAHSQDMGTQFRFSGRSLTWVALLVSYFLKWG